MINSIKTVHAEFYKEFLRAPINILYKNATVKIPVVFFDRFNETPAEIPHAQYPSINIQSYTPRPNKDWTRNQSNYVDGFDGLDEETGLYDTANVYEEPMRLDFRYDVSIVAKTRGEYDALTDWMFKKFTDEGRILLCRVILPNNEETGYPIWYKVEATDIPRSDGVKETNYEFTFNCFVDVVDPVEKEIVNTINIPLNNI